MSRRASVLGAIGFFMLPLVAGAVGSIASMNASEFYARLVKPSWAPPSSLFGPVWTVLYVLMGIAAVLVWRAAPWAATRGALLLFVVHLSFNAAWSWLFFRFHSGVGSFIVILMLWVMIALLIPRFGRFNRMAAFLLIPYLAWVTFATALNLTIWQNNPTLLGSLG